MKQNLKNALAYVFSGFTALLIFLFLLMPYIFNGYERTAEYGGAKNFFPLSGYNCMSAFNSGFGGVMLALTQILFIVLLLVLVVVSIIGILNEFNIISFKINSDKIKLIDINKILLFVMACLTILTVFWTIICVASNGVRTETGFYGYVFGIGSIFTMLLCCGAFVGYYFLERKGIINSSKMLVFKKKTTVVTESPKQTESKTDEIVVTEEEQVNAIETKSNENL